MKSIVAVITHAFTCLVPWTLGYNSENTGIDCRGPSPGFNMIRLRFTVGTPADCQVVILFNNCLLRVSEFLRCFSITAAF